VLGLEVKEVHVVEKLAVEPSEHDERAAYENGRVATPRLGHWVSHRHLGPFVLVNVEAVQVIDVVVVASTQDVERVTIDCRCVTPASAWDLA